MATLQSKFLEFHDSIKLGNLEDEENALLREKRDILLEDLKTIKNVTLHNLNKKISYSNFNQGSYAMGTGIKPKDDDYDIDVMICFDLSRVDIDPVDIKKLVRDALDKNNRTVEIKYPCVRVNYSKGYHVDLALYATEGDNLFLARGKENSSSDNAAWEAADPKGLIHWVRNIGRNSDEREQFRRCVRYLKKWKQEKFTNGFMPTSIGLTILAGQFFSYFPDDDLSALLNIVDNIDRKFSANASIEVLVPVIPYSDVFKKYTDKQFVEFRNKMAGVFEALQNIRKEESLADQCYMLSKVFGKSFPEIAEQKQAEKVECPFIFTGHSA